LDKVKIYIDLIGAGTARVDIGDSINGVSIFPSYLFDGLERLVIAVLLLNKGLPEAECAIFCESPEIMFSFQQAGEVVAWKVYRFYDWGERPLKDMIYKCELIFSTHCKRKQLTNQVVNAFYHLREKYGTEGYRELWQNGFPDRKLAELQELVRRSE
jgi:hypothetical protein